MNNNLNLYLQKIDSIILKIKDGLVSKYNIKNVDLKEIIDTHQTVFHKYAWLFSYNELIKSVHKYNEASKDTHLKQIIFLTTLHFLQKLLYGINLNQVESTRLDEYREFLSKNDLNYVYKKFLKFDFSNQPIYKQFEEYGFNAFYFFDAEFDLYLSELKIFVEKNVVPKAQSIHQNNELIPDSIIQSLSKMEVFAANISKEYGGLDLNKNIQSAITEELSRGYIGVGSLITRNDIASELIINFGTKKQKNNYLPKIANGSILPTAAFTEPDSGSDLSSISTYAEKKIINGERIYVINGEKTWITHGSRSDLVVLLARTDSNQSGYKGLSLLVFNKTRGLFNNEFPDIGISGSEIKVIGYRGMKSYSIKFEDFKIPEDSLLGIEENVGFKQLMTTFENARIQTASRSNGLSKRAFELAFNYSKNRIQFGKSIFAFPRIYQKLQSIFLNLVGCKIYNLNVTTNYNNSIGKQLNSSITKMLCSNYCWINADISFQIHGSYGYAQEFEISRILCDSRIMSIFEGTSEIQAGIIAKQIFKK